MKGFLIKGGTVVTMDGERRIIENGAVAVEGNKIVEIGPDSTVAANHPDKDVIDAMGKVVMPGFVNAHNHMYSVLLRNIDLSDWPADFGDTLTLWWWPKVENTCTKEDAYAGTLLAATEMLKRGVTATADTVEAANALPGVLDRVAEAVNETGIRALVCFETSERISAENGLAGHRENINFYKKWDSQPDARIQGSLSVHTAFSSSPEFVKLVRSDADKLGARIQLHIAQSIFEVDFIKTHFNKDGSVFHLNDLGFLGSDVTAAHCIHISDKEMDILAETGTNISFNVKSNTKFPVGIAPVREMLERGINVGIGLDGDGSDILDMFELMVHSSYTLRSIYLDPATFTAMQALEMATINGAKALGLEDEIGSLEVGKKADIILVDLANALQFTPVHDVLEALVFSARGTDVDTVFVDGCKVVENKSILTVDEGEVIDLAGKQAQEYRKRFDTMPPDDSWILPTI